MDKDGLRTLSWELLAALNAAAGGFLETERGLPVMGASESGFAAGTLDALTFMEREKSVRSAADFLTMRSAAVGELSLSAAGAARESAADAANAVEAKRLTADSGAKISGGLGAKRAFDMEAASEYLRRDSRRYDSRLKKF